MGPPAEGWHVLHSHPMTMSTKVATVGCSVLLMAAVVGAIVPQAQAVSYSRGLHCTPSYQSADSGERVTLSAYYTHDTGNWRELTWSAVGGRPDSDTGDTFRTRFSTSSIDETRVVTVTDGRETATCVVYVTGPEPTPWPALGCSPASTTAGSGERVRFEAWGGTGTYSWYADAGHPLSGSGDTFSTRFTNDNAYGVTRTVTLTSGTRSVTCSVFVYGSPTPTPVWTPTPTPYIGADALVLAMTGRNVTREQSREYTTVNARGGNTLEFILRVRSRASWTLTNVWVADYLPVGLGYVRGSTTLNGSPVSDGITSTGLNIGSLAPGQEAVVRFSVLVDASSVPVAGQVSTTNSAQARASGTNATGASMRVTFGVAPAALLAGTVATGPLDTLVLALVAATLVTGMYAAYTRTGIFARRHATAEISRIRGRLLNFSR